MHGIIQKYNNRDDVNSKIVIPIKDILIDDIQIKAKSFEILKNLIFRNVYNFIVRVKWSKFTIYYNKS